MKTIAKKEKEKKTISLMIKLYCKGKHRQKELCKDCLALENYAHKRIDLCPFMENKSFCSNCKIHCYEEKMRIKIKEVMRYSGPRMLLYDPLMALDHLISSFRERKKNQ